MPAFTRESRCPECGLEYLVSGVSLVPGTETEAPRSFRCECGGWLEAFVPGSVNPARLRLVRKSEEETKPAG